MTPWCVGPAVAGSGRIAPMRKNPAKGRATTPRRRHTVAVAVSHGVSPFALGVACEVFGIDRSAELGVDWYRFKECAVDEPPIRTEVGLTVDAPFGLDALARADTVIVPPPGRVIEPRPELLVALRRAHARGARLVSVCTGAFALAAAGLLDGRRATTHWMYAEELSRRFPAVIVDPGVLYVDEGDILTSAGSAAGIDVCLHVVRNDFGAEVAAHVAREMVVQPHRDGGQAQFIDMPVIETVELTDGDRFAATLAWAQSHLDGDLSVAMLARRSAMSPRTLARRFVERTGTTPGQWLLRQRVVFAQRLLETTDLSVDLVATRSGLGTAANLRAQFQRTVRTSPSAYRRAFRQEAAS